jgi:hypothetical protein
MALYTIIYEHDGGTWIRQVESASPGAAVQKAARQFALDKQVPLDTRGIDLGQLALETPVAVAKTAHVWSVTGSAAKRRALFTIVRTA